jgi:hypothetical protein
VADGVGDKSVDGSSFVVTGSAIDKLESRVHGVIRMLNWGLFS